MNEVLTTSNYDIFKIMKGNRPINESHLRALMLKMQGKGLLVPIIVNKKKEIIDGQHRVAACRLLGLPVQYIIGKDIMGQDYDLRDVQDINSVSKNWNPQDQAFSYAELGNENYKMYLDFREAYGFDKKSSVAMLCGITSDGSNSDFKNGLFAVKNLKYAQECAEKIYQIEPFYKGFRRRSFVIAMLHLFQNKLYKHSHFLQKLEWNASKMIDCTTHVNYMKVIEGIYNWKSRKEDVVRFF